MLGLTFFMWFILLILLPSPLAPRRLRVCVSVCPPSRDCMPQCCISLGGERNALYPVLSSFRH